MKLVRVLGFVTLAVALAACTSTATTSSTTSTTPHSYLTSQERQELAAANTAWAGLQTAHRTILVGSEVQVHGGFNSGNVKLAFIRGHITPPTRFPPSSGHDHGWTVISAQSAFHFLLITKPAGYPPFSGKPPVKVLVVRLGTDTWETAQGVKRLPAWVFSLSGLKGTVSVFALAPSGLFQPRHVDEPPYTTEGDNVSVSGALLHSGGRSITIGFLGGQIGTTGCDDIYKGRVVEEKSIVVVFVSETRDIPPDVFCSLVGYFDQVLVRLAEPLGSRVLVDAATANPVPVT